MRLVVPDATTKAPSDPSPNTKFCAEITVSTYPLFATWYVVVGSLDGVNGKLVKVLIPPMFSATDQTRLTHCANWIVSLSSVITPPVMLANLRCGVTGYDAPVAIVATLSWPTLMLIPLSSISAWSNAIQTFLVPVVSTAYAVVLCTKTGNVYHPVRVTNMKPYPVPTRHDVTARPLTTPCCWINAPSKVVRS